MIEGLNEGDSVLVIGKESKTRLWFFGHDEEQDEAVLSHAPLLWSESEQRVPRQLFEAAVQTGNMVIEPGVKSCLA